MEKAELLVSVSAASECTPQGFYKALNQLREEEKASLDHKKVSLSFFWIKEESERIARVVARYQAPVYQGYFGMLKDGESISYRFKTLRDLELFWVQSVLMAVEGAPIRSNIMSLTPHDWFQGMRPDINERWRKVTTGHPHWAVLTHATGTEMRRTGYEDVESFERMAGANPLHQSESTYLNIVGELVFQAELDDRIVPLIRGFVDGDSHEADSVLDQEGIYKLKIARNRKKAEKIKKRLKRYFSVPID